MNLLRDGVWKQEGRMPSLRSCYRKLGAQSAPVHPKSWEVGLHHPSARTEAMATSHQGGYTALSQYLQRAPGRAEETCCSAPLHLLPKHPPFPTPLSSHSSWWTCCKAWSYGARRELKTSTFILLLGLVAAELPSHESDILETPGKKAAEGTRHTHRRTRR